MDKRWRGIPFGFNKLWDFLFRYVSGTKTGTEATSFEFLRFELPVRLANIMQEINHMPNILQKMPSFAMVKSM